MREQLGGNLESSQGHPTVISEVGVFLTFHKQQNNFDDNNFSEIGFLRIIKIEGQYPLCPFP